VAKVKVTRTTVDRGLGGLRPSGTLKLASQCVLRGQDGGVM